MRALILGGAEGMWEEAARARELFTPDLVIATNHAGRDLEGPLDHWASFHVELFPMWIEARRRAGRPDAGTLWSANRRPASCKIPDLRRVANWGGSSGLLAVTVGLELGCTHMVLAGVPLDYTKGHYDNPKPWRDGANYRRGWLKHEPLFRGKVRSLSGWTAELCGRPDPEWLATPAPER